MEPTFFLFGIPLIVAIVICVVSLFRAPTKVERRWMSIRPLSEPRTPNSEKTEDS